ncbi:VWA domain-containing protein, partial [bacterium]|nr:VWA domain-containing protein [bacterium]
MNVRYRFVFTAFIFFLTACAAMAQPFHIDGATVRGKGGKSVRFFRPSSPDEDWWYSDEVECIHDVGCVDIVFCMDTSGSMSGTISSLQDDIDRFAYNIASVGFDPRFGLVTYSETINFPHGSTLQDLATFSSTLDDARTGDGGFEHHSDAIYQAIDNFDWRPGCEHVVVLISDECDDASTVSPSATISQILSWGGTVYMLTGDCGDVDDFRDYCDTSYGRWFDYGSSDLNDVFDQIVDDISDVVEIDVTVTNTSGGVLDPVVAELVPDFCITVGDSPNPQSFGPIPASGSHTYLWDIEEIPGCSGWGDCFLIRVTSGSYVDSIVGCLFVEDCGCPGPEAEIVCPEYSGRWTACEDQQIDIEYTGYLGVDPNTLCITVNGTVYCYPASPNLTWIPGTRGGTLRFVPSAPGWSHLQHVDIACSAGEDATGCPQLFFPESDFDVDLEPPHPVWWEHHDATWIPPHAAWREPHDDAVSWYPPCGSTLDDTAHIIISALLYDDGVGMTPLDRMIAHLDAGELASMDFVSLWTSLTSIQVTVNDVPFIPGLPIPGSFNRNIDLDLTTYLLDPNSWFGGWAVACTIRADSAGILGLAFLSHEIEVCLKANDLVEADGCMPCENDTEWCCTYYLAGDVPLTADAGPDRYICLGTSTTIGGTPPAGGGVEPYSYSWSPSSGLSSTTIGNPTASPTTTTTYTLTVTDHDGSVATDDMTVFVSNPSADAGRDSTICPGASLPLGGDPTGSGGFGSLTYSWTPTGGLSDPSAANPWFSSDLSWGDTTITFTVTVTDTLGCEATDDIVITVSPIIPDAGPDKMICIGESVTLGGSPTASGGVGPYTYSWYEYPGGTAFSTDANPVVSPSDTTLYVVHISGGDPYCSAVDSCTVYPVQPLADAGADTVVCSGGSVVIGGAPTGSGSVPPYLYEWSSEPAGFISSDANPFVTPLVSTNYIVTVTDSAGCVDVDTVVVDVAPGPSAAYTIPLPCDGITSCENQWINVRIGEGSGGDSRRILWLSDLSYASGRLTDGASIGYSHAAESLATWGWDVEEYPQDSVLTAVMLYGYSVVVIGNVKADGPRMYTAAERTALEGFVANGGHILSMSGWVIPNDDIDLENFLLSGFGLFYTSHDSWLDSLPPVFGSPIDPVVDWVAGYGVKWAIGLDECWAHSGSDCACGVKHFGAGDVVMFFDEHWLFNGPWHDINFTTHQNARLFRNVMSYFAPFDSVSCPVDPASIVLNVDGINYTTADPELSWIDPNLSFNPSVPWAHGDTIIFELINA